MASEEDTLGIYRKLATLSEYKKNSKDRLNVLVRLTFDAMILPPCRFFIIYTFLQFLYGAFLTVYHLLEKFDTETLLKHGSFGGIQLFVLMNMGVVVFMADMFHSYLQCMRKIFFPAELLREEKFKQVVIVGNILKVICFLNMILATIAALGFILAPEYFDRKTYFCIWVIETFPVASQYMLIVMHWTSLVVAEVLAGTAVAWTYVASNVLTQIYVVEEMIAGIMTSGIPPKMRLDSRIYQEQVKQKMILSIQSYENAVSIINAACDIAEAPLMLFAVGSIVLGGSLMIEFLSNQDQDFGDSTISMYIGIFCFSLAGIISANLYLLIGQAIKDESTGCNYNLRQLPWYDMNEENQKVYLSFLLRTEEPLFVQNSLVSIDYLLLLRICKTLYSMAALLAQFVSSQGPPQ